jgi:sugar lactone lactonase YvrE
MRRSAADLEAVGHHLQRPECVVVARNGDCYVPDWRGGVTLIRSDGSQQTWLARDAPIAVRPNALALLPDGDFLLANLGDEGGVWRLTRDQRLSSVVTHVEGRRLPPTNFVTIDAGGRLWISVSTRQHPRQLAWRPDVADGFIVFVDADGPRIVADGLAYTNEVRPDPTGRWLVAVETFGRRLVRFPCASDGSLGRRETVATFGHGSFPDGFAFDAAGGIWVTSLISNRLLRVGPTGDIETLLEDGASEFTRNAEEAFAVGKMTTTHLGPIPGTRLQQLTSVAFGGPDGCLVHLGSLHAPCVYRFRSAPDGGWLPDTRAPSPDAVSRRDSA